MGKWDELTVTTSSRGVEGTAASRDVVEVCCVAVRRNLYWTWPWDCCSGDGGGGAGEHKERILEEHVEFCLGIVCFRKKSLELGYECDVLMRRNS